MDPKIPWLGSGAEPVDRPVWGKADPVFIKRKARAAPNKRTAAPALFHRHSEHCRKNPALFLRPGVGGAHQKHALRGLCFGARKQAKMNKESRSGYTINRKTNRQQEIHRIDSKILHIELLPGKLKLL